MIEDVNIIDSGKDSKDGQVKCPKCGATDISQNHNTGQLRCNFCRHEFKESATHSINDSIHDLVGEHIGSGITDIDHDFNGSVTLKCESCGAEIIIETEETTQARCHWCRNTLSINKQIPNGSVPDAILPFSLKNDEAQEIINRFVKKRRFFAHPKFVREFTTENIMGVYFPYMTVDVNAKSSFSGEGEKLVRSYTVKVRDRRERRYDADVYNVSRSFDVHINDLTIESNSDRLNNASGVKTNNIINAIMPFDIKNCVNWNSNYLKGFSSEKRDVDIDHVRNIINTQSRDIARYKANETLKEFNRGVKWTNEDFEVVGQRWNAVYLPVWLYSYQQKKSGNKSLIHYVAVNARTKEVMGSVPIHMPKLLFASLIAQVLGVIAWFFTMMDDEIYNYVFLLSGIVFFLFYYQKYRNTDARHKHEADTEATMENISGEETYVKRRTGLRNKRIQGANNHLVKSKVVNDHLLNTVLDKSGVSDVLGIFKNDK